MVKMFDYTIIEEVDIDEIIQYLAETETHLEMTTLFEEWRGFAYYYADKIGIPDRHADEFSVIVGVFMTGQFDKKTSPPDLVEAYETFWGLDGISDETKAKLMFEYIVNLVSEFE